MSVFSSSFVNGLHKGRCPGPRIDLNLPYDEHCLFSLDLAGMVSLRIWISARRVFALGVGFVCLCAGGCVEVAGKGWRECV